MTVHKPHQEYFLQDGTKVPGVTTVLQIVNKPALAPAANRLGLQNINTNIYWRTLADIGSIAHFLILKHLNDIQKPDISELGNFSQNQIDKAENSFLSYLEWEKNHKVEPVLLETPMVSESKKYGGTPDCVCHLDGGTKLTLIDFKSGGIYKEAYWQVAAYGYLCGVEKGIILGIPRTADESFDERIIDDLSLGIYPFLKCLELYNAIKAYESQVKLIAH